MLRGILTANVMVAREVVMDILLKLDWKLLSNTFHMSHILCLYHEKNLRFGHLHLVAKSFASGCQGGCHRDSI